MTQYKNIKRFDLPTRTDTPPIISEVAWRDSSGEYKGTRRDVAHWLSEDQTVNAGRLNGKSSSEIFEDYSNQVITGVRAYSSFSNLPSVGESNISYKITNDPDSSLNGYYTWNGSSYEQDASLANGNIIEGDVDAVEGGKIYERVIRETSLNLINNEALEQGTITSSTGDESSSVFRVRSTYIKGSFNIECFPGYLVRAIALYDEGFNWVGNAVGIEDEQKVQLINEHKYSRIIFRNDSDTSILPTENVILSLDSYFDSIESSDLKEVKKTFKLGRILNDIFSPREGSVLNYCFSEYFPVGKGDVVFNNVSDKFLFRLFRYDENFQAIGGEAQPNASYIINDSDVRYIRITSRRNDFADFESGDIEEIQSGIYLKYLTNRRALDSIANKVNEVIKYNDIAYEFQIDLRSFANKPSQDITIIGNEVWFWWASADGDDLDYADVHKYSLDIQTQTISYIETLQHNYGHANTVDYNDNLDCICMGNGSGAYGLNPELIIVDDPISRTQFNRSESLVIDLEPEFGDKINAVWANNFSYNDAVYIISNDTGLITKVILGRDDNYFEYGAPQAPTPLNGWNGTYRILERSYQPNFSYDYVIQGGKLIDDTLTLGYGHETGGAAIAKFKPKGDSISVSYAESRYTPRGGVEPIYTNLGLDATGDYIVSAVFDFLSFIRK